MTEPENRRVLATRARAWPRAIASALANFGVTPNQVSVFSIVLAAGSAYAYWRAAAALGAPAAPWWLAAAIAGIQLRLLCNLLDGLLAIEGGLKAKTGELYNEIPDRFADTFILLGAGVAVRYEPYGIELGVAAAMLAMLTAYVRLFGGALGFKQDFSGPFAKQHRMFALTLGTAVAAIEHAMRGTFRGLLLALIIIVLGTAFTAAARILRLAHALKSR